MNLHRRDRDAFLVFLCSAAMSLLAAFVNVQENGCFYLHGLATACAFEMLGRSASFALF